MQSLLDYCIGSGQLNFLSKAFHLIPYVRITKTLLLVQFEFMLVAVSTGLIFLNVVVSNANTELMV